MRTAALEVENAKHAFARRRFIADLFELVKARLTSLVLLTTAVGFYLGSGPSVDYAALFRVVFGTAAAAAGAAALNQWWERKADALMNRTRMRPVPAGRMRPAEALALGLVLSIFGVGYLALACNGLSAALAAITITIYIFGYMPLKRASTANTVVGAIPGAIPPVMAGWLLEGDRRRRRKPFADSFTWQLPHFFAIAWIIAKIIRERVFA
jgi:protoheme IX farnesyltransferase